MKRFRQIPGALRFADRVPGPIGQQLALMQYQHVVVFADFFNQMGRPEHGQVVLGAECADMIVQRPAAGHIQTNSGFVQQ